MQHRLMQKIKPLPSNVIIMDQKLSLKVVKVFLSTDSLLLEKEMVQNVVQKLVMALLMFILVQDKALMQRWNLNLISFRD